MSDNNIFGFLIMSGRSPCEFESIASLDPQENLRPFTFHLSNQTPQPPRSCSDVKDPTVLSNNRSKSYRSQLSHYSQIHRKSQMDMQTHTAAQKKEDDDFKLGLQIEQNKITEPKISPQRVQLFKDWKRKAGLNYRVTAHDIVKHAIYKLKQVARLWQPYQLSEQTKKFLKERYIESELWSEGIHFLQPGETYRSHRIQEFLEIIIITSLAVLSVIQPLNFNYDIPRPLMNLVQYLAVLGILSYLLFGSKKAFISSTFSLALSLQILVLVVLSLSDHLVQLFVFLGFLPLSLLIIETIITIKFQDFQYTNSIKYSVLFFCYLQTVSQYYQANSVGQNDYIESLSMAFSSITPFGQQFVINKNQQIVFVVVQIMNILIFISIFRSNIINQKSDLRVTSEKYRIIEARKQIQFLPLQARRSKLLQERKRFNKNPLFRQFSDQIVKELLINMKQIDYNPQEQIYNKNQFSDAAIYVLCRGTVQLYDEPHIVKSDTQRIPIYCIREGEVFGAESLFDSQGYQFTTKTLDFVTVLKLDAEVFMGLLQQSRIDRVIMTFMKETFHSIKNSVVFNNDYSKIFEYCRLCNENNHLSTRCPKIHYLPNQEIMRTKLIIQKQQMRQPYSRYRTEQVNTLYNLQKIQESCKIFVREQELTLENSEDLNDDATDNYEEDQIQRSHEADKLYSYKDVLQYDHYISRTQTSKPVSSNIEKQRSNEIVSAQTLKEIVYDASIKHHVEPDQEDQTNDKDQVVNRAEINRQKLPGGGTLGMPIDLHRSSLAKGTLNTAGFHNDDMVHQFGIFDHRNFHEVPIRNPTQNSNTYKSSQSVSNSHPNSHHSNKSQPKQPTANQKKSPEMQPIQLRAVNPKLTFQFNPENAQSPSPIRDNRRFNPGSNYTLSPQEIQFYNYRGNNRAHTNYANYKTQSGLAVVSEESGSNVGVPFPPVSSAISISSMGHQPSIDDQIPRIVRDRTFNNRHPLHNQTSVSGVSGVSPGKTSRESTPITERKGTGSYSQFRRGSNFVFYDAQFQFEYSQSRVNHIGDLDHTKFYCNEIDIDCMQNYQVFNPQNNVLHVLNRMQVQYNAKLTYKASSRTPTQRPSG